jgi:hypothetical protein
MDLIVWGLDVGVGSGGCKRMQAIKSINVTKAALINVVLRYPIRENRLFSRMGWIMEPSEQPATTSAIAKVCFFLK